MSMSHQHGPACSCDDCCARPLTRNHYFTGKLLVERDFTDEQWYFREKIRLHHQRLQRRVRPVDGIERRARHKGRQKPEDRHHHPHGPTIAQLQPSLKTARSKFLESLTESLLTWRISV